MKTVFMEFLQQQGLVAEEISGLCQQAEVIKAAAKTTLIQQGDFAQKIYFLIDGVCHASYITSAGKQYSKEFYWEKEFIVGFESLITQQTSPYMIETVTPSLLLALPIAIMENWRKTSHPLYIKLLEIQLINKEIKERVLLLNTPEERYKLFCNNFPELQSRLTDYQIAAYLGITAISLSRIKKRLQN